MTKYARVYGGRVLRSKWGETELLRTPESIKPYDRVTYGYDREGYLVAYLSTDGWFRDRFFHVACGYMCAGFGAHECMQLEPRGVFTVLEGVIAPITGPLKSFLRRDGDNAIMYRVVQLLGIHPVDRHRWDNPHVV